MKILIITHYFPPFNSIASLRPYSWAKYWTLAGHDVTVLTTQKNTELANELHLSNPGYRVVEVPIPKIGGFLKKKVGFRRKDKSGSEDKGPIHRGKEGLIRKIYRKLRDRTGVLSFCRMPDKSDLWITPAFKQARALGTWDLIVSTYCPYATHIVAWKLKTGGYAPLWVADYRDLWTEHPAFSGLWPFTFIENLLEKRLLRDADLLSTVSESLALSLRTRFKNKKVVSIPNGFDPDEIAALSPELIFPLDGNVRIVYTGSIYGLNQDPTPLFRAIRELRDNESTRQLISRLKVLFAGPPSDALLDGISHFNLQDIIEWRGFLSREDSLRMQRDADILLFLSWRKSEKGLITGKLYEYLGSQTPILSVGGHPSDDADEMIRSFGAGWVCNQDTEAIKKIIVDALGARAVKKGPGVKREMLVRFHRKILADELLRAASGQLC